MDGTNGIELYHKEGDMVAKYGTKQLWSHKNTKSPVKWEEQKEICEGKRRNRRDE
jgi:hypothetical protein